jgi:hypothetical protein
MKRRLMRPVMQDYRNRDYVLCSLDNKVFDILNEGTEGDFLMFTGCLDALEQIPSGSMVSTGARYYDQGMTVRGSTLLELEEREALASRLIAEILAEEEQKK